MTIQDLAPLEELERLQAEFLGMVSHELRTPLISIKGSAATVLSASADPDPAEMLQFFRVIDEQPTRPLMCQARNLLINSMLWILAGAFPPSHPSSCSGLRRTVTTTSGRTKNVPCL